LFGRGAPDCCSIVTPWSQLAGAIAIFEPIPAAYSPDSLTNFEVGAKGRLFEGLFDYQADVYYIRWSIT
jgi:hypothetical protein